MLGSIRRSGWLAMAALALCAGSVPVLANQPALVSAVPRPAKAGKRSLFGRAVQASGRYGRKGAGVTMAQQQRSAAKKRGIARNRRHHR